MIFCQIGNHPSVLDDPIYHQKMLFMDGKLYLTELSNQIHPYVIAKDFKNQYKTDTTNIPCQIDGNNTLTH